MDIALQAGKYLVDRVKTAAQAMRSAVHVLLRLRWAHFGLLNTSEIKALMKKLRYVHSAGKYTRDEINVR